MAATSSALLGHQVPEWVGRNAKIFQAQRGADPSKRTRSFEGTLLEQKQVHLSGNVQGAARARADLSEEDGQGSIDPPALLPPASYYQDVRNHGNIASTMLATARRRVGFEPSLAGPQVSAQQMDEFVTKFYEWIEELKEYRPYLETGSITASLTLRFNAHVEHEVRQTVSLFVGMFSGLSEEVAETWRQSLTNEVRAASSYVTEHGAGVSSMSFQLDVLETSGKSNPVHPLSFGRTNQTDSIFMFGTTYRVNSDAIIADADYFAQNGITIFGARQYRDYVNNGR